ncbi:helix-turn-helix domain-containing protein [Streptomyces sp. NPDC059477]|uniref:helix-turn-helix domain-containing protein n=1 Tax=Streptomyces sp. NPDC059477 TaxID=3346847 RepID=UPI0036C99F61
MTESLLSTADVPEAEAFDYWLEMLASACYPMALASDLPDRFHGEMRVFQLGDAKVWPSVVDGPVEMERSLRLIRQSDPEFYHLTLMRTGVLGVEQSGRAGIHGPGSMYFVDSSRPHTCLASGRFTVIGLEIPKALVPLPVADLVTRPLSGNQGIGRLLAGLLTDLASGGITYRCQDGERLETVLVDLLTTVLAHHLDARQALPPDMARRTLMLRIRAFIRRNLHDPDLSPGTLATAHHISLSHLHGLFQDAQHTTVAAYIRHLRLEAARRDLADPAQHTVPVHRIAARWGFTHHATFTRIFRTRYHMTPSDYRHSRTVL